MFKRIHLVLILGACLIITPFMTAEANTDHTIAKQAIMLDYDTGMVMFEKNADERMPTSSMSKTMTMYKVFEALRNGKLSLDTELKVSEKAWRMGGSKMFVEVDDTVRVEDLIRGVAIQSGNDATIVLAEGLAGSEDDFAHSITEKAKEIGMNSSNFKNASGWPDPEHYSTARDLATLSAHIIRDFPEHYHYFAEKEFTYNNISQQNRNPLLFRDIGADGIKTGHTEDGGYGLMASGVRDGRRVILVVNGLADNKERAQESARLLEWGLRGFKNYTLFAKGEEVSAADVALGQSENVPLVARDDVLVTVPLNLKNDLKVDVVYNSPLMAPVQEGDEVAKLKIAIPRGETVEVPLYAGKTVKGLGFVARTLMKTKMLMSGNADG